MTATALLAQLDLAQAEIDAASRRLQNLRAALLQGGSTLPVGKNPALSAFASARNFSALAMETIGRIQERPVSSGKARK